jgi:O-antigen ligase
VLTAAVAVFGGVYLWGAAILSIALSGLLFWIRPPLARQGWLAALDVALLAILGGILVQLLPLPGQVVSAISPAHVRYFEVAALESRPASAQPLTLAPAATVHAWLATFCTVTTFWLARTVFSRGGIRTVVTALAWVAVGVVLVALAQGAIGTPLIYGFWKPYDAGARPLGPFVNRNHCGTWTLLALMLCYGCFEWRRAASSPARGWSWRARVAHALDGRSIVLVLATVLLTICVALGASRSTMIALACAAAYVAVGSPRTPSGRRGSWWTVVVGGAAGFACLAYADVPTLLSRIDETRQLGLAQRAAIWRDTLGVVRDFPIAGVGAGSFSTAMRLYQTSDRTYFWNEPHNQYLQVAAEGGLLLGAPAGLALIALVVCARRRLRRDDPMYWMRLGAAGALVGAAVQALWETGLSLPANGMLAAVAAAILLHQPRSHAAARD